jgi:hypothetical protein
VRRRLDEAFDAIPSEVIYKCVKHSEGEVDRVATYLKDLRLADEAHPAGVYEESEDDEDSGSECDLSDYGVDVGASDDDMDVMS